MEEKIELDEIGHLAQQFVSNTSRHVFLTGKAGTGKTTLLKHVLSKSHKKTVIAAPTGIAAINAGGVTLHSLFQLPFGAFVPGNFSLPFDEMQQKIHTPVSLLKEQKLNATKRQLLREIELLIIDEVSMLRADLLDAIDLILKKVRREPNRSFGGVQILFIGDLYQLPPVVKKEEMTLLHEFYNSLYFFDALSLKQESPIYLELSNVHRQSDARFIDLLNRIREQELTEEDQYLLQDHFAYDGYLPEDDGHIYLTTHNAKASAINEEKLNSLPSEAISFDAKISGKFDSHLYPNEEKLILKEGAQVMFIKNDPTGQQRYYNGKIGTITELTEQKIVVSLGLDDITLERYIWENKRYKVDPGTREIEENLVGEFAQYPIKLAWAVTVHKSQGLTFEKAILDLADSFAPGQFYVAMSRLTSLGGLTFASEIPRNSFQIDPALQDFTIKAKSTDILEQQLIKDQRSYILELCTRAFDFNAMDLALSEMIRELKRTESLGSDDELWKSIFEWERLITSWTKIGERFSKEIFQIGSLNDDAYLTQLSIRINDGYEYFKQFFSEMLSETLSRGHSKPYQSVAEFQAIWKEWYLEVSARALTMLRAKLITRNASSETKNTSIPDFASDPDFIQFTKPYKTNSVNQKVDSKEVTLTMYREGMNAEEIAINRQLAPGTIFSHLAFYVETGELNVFDFISKTKLKNILIVSSSIESEKLSDIKSKLGDEYTYEDIRIALAHNKRQQSQIK